MPKRGRKRAAVSRGKGKNKMLKKASETPVAFSSDNLNNSSAATSMNMIFPTAENNFIEETTNPVVSSIGSLSPTDTASNVLSSPAAYVTNNASNDSLGEPNLLPNMANNFPIDTGIQTESDDEVQYIGEQRYVADNLNNNSSAVTNMNLRLSTAENNFIVENVDPVALSIGSLPPTDTASNVLASKLLTLQKYFESLEECDASNDCPVEPDLFPNIVNNFPIDTGNQAESDDDVQYIGEQRDVEAPADFNPSMILNVLMEQQPQLKRLVERTRYMSDAFITQLYACLNKNSNNIGTISKLTVALRKCRAQLKKALEPNDTLEGLNKSVEAEYKQLLERNQDLESQLAAAVKNSNMIIRSLKNNITKNVQKKIEAEYWATVNEKDKKLREAEEILKNLKEKYRCMKNGIEDTEVETALHISPQIISIYKRNHYCCVCEMPATFVCCLHTSYCDAKCQERHAEEHKKHCKRVL